MAASTIVIASENLSFLGVGCEGPIAADNVETHFFNVVQRYNPDVIILDLTRSTGNGISTILRIRRRSYVPILVICGSEDTMGREYRLAGAVECMRAPAEITQVHLTVQKIKKLSQEGALLGGIEQSHASLRRFSGMTLHPHENLLTAPTGSTVKLTTSENRMLRHFLDNPNTLCTRDVLTEVLYGMYPPSSNRAVDRCVAQLRKKLVSLTGASQNHMIKTEFRQGYLFNGQVQVVRETLK